MVRRLVGFLALAGVLLATSAATTRGQDSATEPIRRAAEAYIAAMERGDAAELARLWTAEGDFMDSSGRVTKGRDLVKYVAQRAAGNRPDIMVTVDSIRLVNADAAIEDGIAEASAPDGGGFAVARYSAVWVRRGGQWLLDCVRESPPQQAAGRDYLRLLGWMAGNWVHQGEERIELSCRWSPDKNYLLREIRVGAAPGRTMTISQRIGWDAEKKQLTAWTFDSDGGHAVGQMQRQGNQWIVSARGVLPDGQVVSSVNTCTRTGNDGFTWESSSGSPSGGQSAGGQAAGRKLQFVREPQSKQQ
jgi:uncharacterized protein (TIGR02246 family)